MIPLVLSVLLVVLVVVVLYWAGHRLITTGGLPPIAEAVFDILVVVVFLVGVGMIVSGWRVGGGGGGGL